MFMLLGRDLTEGGLNSAKIRLNTFLFLRYVDGFITYISEQKATSGHRNLFEDAITRYTMLGVEFLKGNQPL